VGGGGTGGGVGGEPSGIGGPNGIGGVGIDTRPGSNGMTGAETSARPTAGRVALPSTGPVPRGASPRQPDCVTTNSSEDVQQPAVHTEDTDRHRQRRHHRDRLHPVGQPASERLEVRGWVAGE